MSQQDPVERGASTVRHWSSPDDSPLSIVEGDGARVYDPDGTEFLDFRSDLYCVNAGYSNQAILDAMSSQGDRIPYVSPQKHNDARSQLADELAEIAPGDLSSVFFGVSGSEANEAAAKIAREYTGKNKILTRWQSYHGSTYGAGSLTGDPGMRANMERYAATSGSGKFLPPLAYRSPFYTDDPDELARRAAEHLEWVIRNEGADSIAAILTEPIGGSSGAFPAPAGYFQRVREICDDYDILLISDEVICGFGRCGDWFGIGTEDVEPDMITFAKGITSAYVPLSGVIAREEIGEHLEDEGFYLGHTFGGHPMGCAAGLAAIEEYRSELIDNVREHAPYFEERLRDLASDHGVVGDVRGRGFHWGIEITDPETGDPFFDPWGPEDGDNPVADVIDGVLDRGVLVAKGRPGYQIILSPPLVVDRDDIDEAVNAISGALTDVFD